MRDEAAIRDYLRGRTFAIVGASRDRKKFGNIIYRNLKVKGFNVYPVNPNVDTVEGDTCYPSLRCLPQQVEGIVLVIPGEKAAGVIQEAYDCGIRQVWMQPGAEAQDAIALCGKLGMNCVYGSCIMVLT